MKPFKHFGQGLMAGKQTKGFDIKQKTDRSPVGPGLHHGGRWQSVVAGIHFHQGKVVGVIAQPFFRRFHVGRIKLAAVHQTFVGPAGRPD